MLVLSRRKGDAIVISKTNPDGSVTEITVHVVSVRGATARIGIVAPLDYRIGRPDAKTGPKKAK